MARPNSQNPPGAPEKASSSDWLKPVGTCIGLLIILAGSNLLWSGLSSTPGEKPFMDFIVGFALLGGAFGIIGVAWGWFDPSPPRAALKPWVFYGVGAVLTVFVPLFILHYGMCQIGGNDHAILVDVGWRLINGQTAYVDFPCTLPAEFVIGIKLAFQWFGVNWQSNVIVTALFAMVTFAWLLLLLAQLFGRSWATILWALALHAITVMVASFWWYNPTTYVSAVLYMFSATYWLRRPGEKIAMVSYGAALLLLATMKVNAAGVLIPLISALLFFSPRHRWKVVGISLGAFALFLLLLAINHLSFTGMLTGYLSVSQRGATISQFLQFMGPSTKRLVLTGTASLLLPVIVVLYQGRKALLRLASWIPVIAALNGVYGFLTNTDGKLVDMQPLLGALLLLAAELRGTVNPKEGPVFQMPVGWNRFLTLFCVVLGSIGLAQGMARERVKAIGIPLFFEYDGAKHTLTNGFFKGVQCGDIFDEMLKEEAEVMRREPSSTIWFGPRMQWGYAVFNKPSPLQQPVGWDSGLTMYPKSKEEYYFNSFLQSRPQLGILFKNDVSYFSKEEVQRIAQQYNVDQSFPLLTVLHLKQ
jgi:hypothetical protein